MHRLPLVSAVLLAVFVLAGCHHHGHSLKQHAVEKHEGKDYGKQPPGPTWTALDPDSSPGTPATVTLDLDASGPTQTTFDLTVHGFWVEERQGPDGRTYQRVEFPGLGSGDTIGAPDLPVLRFDLAVPTTAEQAVLAVEIGDAESFEGYRIWPQVVPENDHAEGDPERFVRNEEIYDGEVVWPPADGRRETEVAPRFRSIPATSGEIWPARWDPASGELRVVREARYTVQHAGALRELAPISKERARLAAVTFLNWQAVLDDFDIAVVTYDAEFLVLYPSDDYADELAPFVAQKKARGFLVTEMTSEEAGTACCEIRETLAEWLEGVPPQRDAYALLVGDSDVIPNCDAPIGVPTDDLYGSPAGDDLWEEIYVGRLSVDSEADAAQQIDKILTYEDNPSQFCCYDRAALWAHKEDAPAKYVGAHEKVRTASYAVPPTFSTHYGHLAGVTDATIVDRVDSGVGVLAYRGHGSRSSTATGWNLDGDYFDSPDAEAVTNPVARSPVVWSFACTNSQISADDSIAEVWMERPDTGAVSYYGSTVASRTSQNHVLDEWMFKAVYDEGLVTQSHAIQRAEAQMAAIEGSRNAWMYLLLGDPDMQIRRRNPLSILVAGLDRFTTCTAFPCRVELQVHYEDGNPIPDALVGLWKAGANGGDEVFVNRYTDGEGRVTLEASPATAGTLYVAVEDGDGNAHFGEVEIGPRG